MSNFLKHVTNQYKFLPDDRGDYIYSIIPDYKEEIYFMFDIDRTLTDDSICVHGIYLFTGQMGWHNEGIEIDIR
jgi:hypothetical protein